MWPVKGLGFECGPFKILQGKFLDWFINHVMSWYLNQTLSYTQNIKKYKQVHFDVLVN